MDLYDICVGVTYKTFKRCSMLLVISVLKIKTVYITVLAKNKNSNETMLSNNQNWYETAV